MTERERSIFQRNILLFGEEKMLSFSQKRVIIFGIGGVGSWCAESLVRSGIKYLTLVDSDIICKTNVNRQLHATSKTVGEVKVEVLKQRLLEINPDAEITAIQKVYRDDTRDFFQLHTYDYIVDAIDSLSYKVDLIQSACKTDAHFVSSLGASLKLDSTKIKVAEFWKAHGCPLGAAVRKRLRKTGIPAKKFLVVYSDELLKNAFDDDSDCGSSDCFCKEKDKESQEIRKTKSVTNGTVAHITAIFGFTLAGLVVKHAMGEK